MLLVLSQQDASDPRSLIDQLVAVSGIEFADAMRSLNHLELEGLITVEWEALQTSSSMTVTALGRGLLIAAGLRRLQFATRRSRPNPVLSDYDQNG